MFDIAVSELGGVAGVALVVIGPKDLPTVLRTMRQWTSKARSMAREFQSGLDDMVREAELDDLRKAAKQVTDFSIENEIKKAVDPDGSMAEDFKKTEAEMNAMLADAEKPEGLDRKSVGEGKSVSVRVDLGGRRNIKKKTPHHITITQTQ